MDTQTKGRTLIFSQRNIFGKALFRCALHEFEDFICQFDSAELLAPHVDPTNKHHAFAKRIAFHAPIALNPGLSSIRIKGEYELFLAVCGSPTDLLMVNAVSDWRTACQTSACLIDEAWVKAMPGYRYFLDILRRFDFVFLYYSQSVRPLAERTGRKCAFLPPGVDALAFCPFPNPPGRVIDVYSIGRRSAATHQKLLKMAAQDGLFYLHDSVAGDQAIDSREHRALFVNLAKRSKYFLVNPGLIDRPETRGDQIEIGNRYFEGAASGTIMVGERPNNAEFERLFDWPDALIDLPYGSDQIDRVLQELDREPERRERISRTNVAQALLRHDWAYRWESILQTVGLEPTAGLAQRKEDLTRMAEMVLSD
jgi:hypothetical protein